MKSSLRTYNVYSQPRIPCPRPSDMVSAACSLRNIPLKLQGCFRMCSGRCASLGASCILARLRWGTRDSRDVPCVLKLFFSFPVFLSGAPTDSSDAQLSNDVTSVLRAVWLRTQLVPLAKHGPGAVACGRLTHAWFDVASALVPECGAERATTQVSHPSAVVCPVEWCATSRRALWCPAFSARAL